MKRSDRKRYVVVGVGKRAEGFIKPLVTRFQSDGELVGICDTNPTRLAFCNDQLKVWGHHPVATYPPDQFDQMVHDVRPDVVIVATVDAFHAQYIVRALKLGCEVVTEKPICVDQKQCQDILSAATDSDKKIRVTFNARWSPGATLIRQLLDSKIIGEVIHVNMEYLLDAQHGADYFRRWHRDKSQSGGLIVHKSTHHFDLVNWWLDAVPETVFGFGKLAFYGKRNAESRGLEFKYDRYTGHDTTGDPFAYHIDNDEKQRRMYYEAEKHDGYVRDKNVFGAGVTIEDSMSVLVRYHTGAVLNYCLNAYLPYEGFTVKFSGTQGRLEYSEFHVPNKENPADARRRDIKCVVYPLFEDSYEVAVPKLEGGHGGSDPLIQEQIFSSSAPKDRLGRNAWHEQGVASAIIGIAANQSFLSGNRVNISEICPELGRAKMLHELR